MKPTPKLFGALFIAMALLCAAALVTAAVRISAADKKADRLGDDLEHARADLRTSREQAEAANGQNAQALQAARQQVATTSPEDLARGLAEASFDLPLSTCNGSDDNCDSGNRKALPLQLSRCGGTQFCVSGSKWISGSPTLTLDGGTWSTRGSAVSGRAACYTVPTSGAAWEFTAKVAGAQYTIAGGWKTTKISVTFSATVPAATRCSATTIWWKGTVSLL